MVNWFSGISSIFSKRSVIRKNTMLTLCRQLTAAAIQLLTVIIIARQLGPEGNGLYAMAILLPTMLVTFLNCGIGPAAVYYLGKRELIPQQVFRANTRLAIKIIIAGFTFALPVMWFLGEHIFPSIPLHLLFIGIVVFPVSLLLSVWVAIYQGVENFKIYNFITLVPSSVTFVVTVLFLFLFKWGIESVVSAFLVGQLVGLGVLQRHIRNFAKTDTPPSPEVEKKLLSYGWKAHLSNIMAFVNYRADIFLINFLMGPAATGVYVIAVQFAEKLWMLSQAASTVLLPRLSSMKNESKRRHDLSLQAGWIIGLITLFASLFLTLFLHYFLVPIFGQEYERVFIPFLWLLPGIILGATARIYSNTIAATGKPEWNFYASFIVITVNVIGNLMLIPKLGLAGAAIATSLAYGLNFMIKSVLIFKLKHLTDN